MADLLWGHGQASSNLRVEIHRLNGTLQEHGLAPFEKGCDPLALSADIGTPEGEGLFCEGLDDVSPQYQFWLEQHRARYDGGHEASFQDGLVEDLAARICAPFVIVAAGLPGSGRRDLARQLAAQLHLPLIDGGFGDSPAVRYIVPSDENEALAATHIVADQQSVWVVERSFFGEDPELVLQLRSRLPADRLRFIKLPPLNWWHVKKILPADVKFAEGARLFLASGGNRQYLDELIELRTRLGSKDELPVPLRMRAAIALEMRSLSPAARRALEVASVHRGVFTFEALEALGATEHLDELERNGWLTFATGGWLFSHELVRRLIEGQLQEGVKRRSHTTLALQQAREGAYLAAEFHRQRGSGEVTRQPKIFEGASVVAHERPRKATVVVGHELWLDEAVTGGTGVLVEGDKLLWSRSAASSEDSKVSFVLEEETVLVRIRGRAQVEDGLARDFTGPVAALTLALPRAPAVDVHLCDVDEPDIAVDSALRLPIGTRFEYWLLTPAAGVLQIASRAHAAVIEMKVNVFRPLAPPTTETAGQGVVEAFVLERNLVGHERDNWSNHEVQRGPRVPEVAPSPGS